MIVCSFSVYDLGIPQIEYPDFTEDQSQVDTDLSCEKSMETLLGWPTGKGPNSVTLTYMVVDVEIWDEIMDPMLWDRC